MPRDKQDSIESRDPRERAGLLKAVPKKNLGKLVLEKFDSYKAFERVVGFTQVGDMVKGNRRMTNAKLLKAASVLQVSPLYLLDLTDSMQPEAEEVACRVGAMRKAIASDITTLNDADLTRKKIDYYIDQEESFPSIGFLGESVTVFLELVEIDSGVCFPLNNPLDVYENDPEDINPEYARLASIPHIQNIRGDYRDLNQLAQDMLAMYPDTLAALLAQPPMRGSDQL